MSHLLDEAKANMDRAKREAEDLRRRYNEAADRFNTARAKYNRLVARKFEIDLQLSRERDAAVKRGEHQLAALLVTNPPALR